MRYIHSRRDFTSKKARRQSGRKTPKLAIKGKFKEIIGDCLEPQEFWDDWCDFRDGIRHSFDNSKIRSKYMCCADKLKVERFNKKLKKQLKIRKAKKEVFLFWT